MARKPVIMIVEDEVDLANSIAGIIKDTKNYETIVAYSAKEAMKHLGKNRVFTGGNLIKLVLLDIKMPEMDGLKFLEKIREAYPPDKLGVFIITAWEDHDKFEKAREGAVVGYIKKPFNSKELIESIDRFFEGKSKWMTEQTKWETLSREEDLPEEKIDASDTK